MSDTTKILIVDDDPDIRNVLNLLLRRDYATAEAANGMDAVAYMQNHRDTDLVILDVMMPGMDGIETCEKIRSFSNVPILFLTAKSAERDRRQNRPDRAGNAVREVGLAAAWHGADQGRGCSRVRPTSERRSEPLRAPFPRRRGRRRSSTPCRSSRALSA